MKTDQERQILSIPANIDEVRDLIFSDHRIGLKHISEALNISYERVYPIIHVDFNMKIISAKRIPKRLNVAQ